MLGYNTALFPYPEYHSIEYDEETGEWRCPYCNRTIKFKNRKMIVIEKGNEFAIHSGSKGGLSIVGVNIE